MNFLEKTCGKIFDCVLAAPGRKWDYLIHYKRNFDNLKPQVKELQEARDRLQRDCKNNVRTIEADVQTWLTLSDGILAEAEEFIRNNGQAKMTCCNGWRPNLKSHYQVSKRASKMGLKVKEIKDKGKFDEVGYRKPTQVVGTATLNTGYEAFESRMQTLTGVLDALKDPKINRIGVYGMGGVGKTMLAKEVVKQAQKDQLFDKYLFLVVSKDPDLKNIQREIAEQLDLKLEVESESVRGDQLCKRLKQEKKTLIIIDDIWKPLNLEDLGISFGDDQKGCKLLLTSRFSYVLCNDMDTQKQFQVGVLFENEARNLFENIVGDLAKTPEIQPNMLEIVKECSGLPIAITTVANTLKNEKHIYVWKDAIKLFKTSVPIKIDGVDEKVYKSVKWSYESLKSNEAKSLWLLCSLHREDYNIKVEDLLKYGVGLSLFGNLDKIEDARRRVHTLVEKLKNSSLLLEGDGNGTVKMHDVIRDVAINIAAEERQMFMIRNTTNLQEHLNRKDSFAISLPYIDDCDLSRRFECPNLHLFFMFNQKETLQIPISFFEGLKEVRVLSLSQIWFETLPSSHLSIEKLQTLCLEGTVEDVTIIGELTNLKILRLSLENFEQLPKEIGHLTHLQLLDLEECFDLKVIPPNVLSKMKILQELYLPSTVEWEVEEQSTERSNAMVSELDNLYHLIMLHIHIQNYKILPKAMVFERLVSYRIVIGSDLFEEEMLEASRILKLNISFQSDDGYKVLLKKCEALSLGEMKGVKNILYEVNSEGFQSLKHLTVQHNDEQYIIKSMGVLSSVFPILESINLSNMINLERICYTRLPAESFRNLQVVKVRECRNLEFVFSSSMVECFSHLQEMEIVDCEKMSEIIVIERKEEIEINSDENIMFAQLRSLTMSKLLKLKGFFSDDEYLVLFNGKVVFPNLEKLEIEGMDSMKMIWPDQVISESFWKLENLTVSNFTNLTNILPPDMLTTLQNLKHLKIDSCGSIEEVFEIQQTNNVEETHNIVATELISLEFVNLGKLKHVWSMDPQGIITFAKLRKIEIEGCSSLKSVFPTSVAKALMQLEWLWIRDCATVEEIVAKEEGIETATLFVFPLLISLTLESLPELKSFYPGKHTSEWPLLSWLTIRKCDKLKIFGSNEESVKETNGLGHDVGVIQPLFFSEKDKFLNWETLHLDEGDAMNETCGGLSPEFYCNLKYLYLYGNHDKQSVFPNVEDPIARAGVSDFRRLKNIVPFSSTSFHYLMELGVYGSDVLISLLTPSTARTLVQLKQITIYKCKRMTEIVANEGSEAEAGDEIAFNNLKYLRFDNLPSLTAFHLGTPTIKFPSLDTVRVDSCPKLKIFYSGVLSTPKLTCIRMEGKWIRVKKEGDGDVDLLNARIKEYWEAKLETCDQKFAEKIDASEGGESEHDANDDLERETTSEVGDTQCWEAKLETCDQKFAEKTDASEGGESEHDANDDLEREATSEVGDTQCWEAKLETCDQKFTEKLRKASQSLPESSSTAAEGSLAKTQDSPESSSPMTETPKISDETDVSTNYQSNQDGVQDVFSFQRMKVSEISQLRDLPKNLHSLKIEGCDVLENIGEEVIARIPTLQRLYIINCCSLKSFTEPIALKILHIQNCKKLEFPPPARETNQYALLEHLCIGNSFDSLTSLPLNLFPRLRCLSIWDCKNLESFSMLEGYQKVLASLEALEIRDCPNLVYFPEGGLPTPSLTSIWLSKCKNLKELPHQLHTLDSLLSIFINNCPELVSLPEGGLPSNLSLLCITCCDKLTLMREWGLIRLDCLIKLEIEGGCENVESFPEEKLLPSNLNSLRVSRLLNLQSLDYKGLQHLTALKTLEISCCDKLESLPEEGLPSSLSVLCIKECSLLKPKLQKQTGDYWPKIAHISFIETDEEVKFP